MLTFPKVHSMSPQASFLVSSGALAVTDPCYRDEPWCSGVLVNVRNGTWAAEIGYYRDEGDIAAITRHRDELAVSLAELSKERAGGASAGFMLDSLKRATASLATYLGRPAFLRVWHTGVPAAVVIDPTGYEILDFTVGVDSGQAGFFD